MAVKRSAADIEQLRREFLVRAEAAFEQMLGADGQDGLVTFTEREDRACEVTDALARWVIPRSCSICEGRVDLCRPGEYLHCSFDDTRQPRRTKGTAMKHIVAPVRSGFFIAVGASLAGCTIARTETRELPRQHQAIQPGLKDQELARLLVKLELKARAVVAGPYIRADTAHRGWLARNKMLPAAVADAVFHDVVRTVTNGRAWVKMVVDEPRNPNNTGDATAIALLREIRDGTPLAERVTRQAYYYAEPIKAARTCLACHGEPRGEPDPFFPQYKKNGWREGETVGAVIARVASIPVAG